MQERTRLYRGKSRPPFALAIREVATLANILDYSFIVCLSIIWSFDVIKCFQNQEKTAFWVSW